MRTRLYVELGELKAKALVEHFVGWNLGDGGCTARDPVGVGRDLLK
jgi:hypothetical protein